MIHQYKSLPNDFYEGLNTHSRRNDHAEKRTIFEHCSFCWRVVEQGNFIIVGLQCLIDGRAENSLWTLGVAKRHPKFDRNNQRLGLQLALHRAWDNYGELS